MINKRSLAFLYILPWLLLTFPTHLNANSLAIFKGQGADTDFMELPSDILNRELVMEPTFFWGLNYSQKIKVGNNTRFNQLLKPEWEMQVSKHNGLQNNYEAHLAILVRTRNIHDDIFNINFAAGMGPSYAFSTPTYEDGPDGKPNDGSPSSGQYQFQSYMTVEIELSLRNLPGWKLPVRIHHRSGIYGLIAPRRVGSNFFAIGLRYSF